MRGLSHTLPNDLLQLLCNARPLHGRNFLFGYWIKEKLVSLGSNSNCIQFDGCWHEKFHLSQKLTLLELNTKTWPNQRLLAQLCSKCFPMNIFHLESTSNTRIMIINMYSNKYHGIRVYKCRNDSLISSSKIRDVTKKYLNILFIRSMKAVGALVNSNDRNKNT